MPSSGFPSDGPVLRGLMHRNSHCGFSRTQCRRAVATRAGGAKPPPVLLSFQQVVHHR